MQINLLRKARRCSITEAAGEAGEAGEEGATVLVWTAAAAAGAADGGQQQA